MSGAAGRRSNRDVQQEQADSAELAATVSAAAGTPIACTDLPADTLVEGLTGTGLPAGLAHVLADADLGDSGDLSRLIGRPTTSLTDAMTAALR
ncbi:Rossmann-fold NAD(P)-binding domain-containing protein [Amycolatopsis eburnea]|uniref:SDR family NAD(P)-dependent oxidoreductase n=1 Tax=Amycolatopsis eburnea TaxID=2267691 RepID=A0A3R9F333_9PSEU|nr:hypothetical protein [Amycolatopsis eburnea]RSD09208.1 hypothetical protein EIY87_39810 [Amycolatopsis eburnea]